MENPPVKPDADTANATRPDPPTAGPTAGPNRKRPYMKPAIRELGSLRKVTMASMTGNSDGVGGKNG